MAKPADTYSKNAQKTGNPRELEAQLLMRAAAKLQALKNVPTTDLIERINALRFNRSLWLVFADLVTQPENPLPREIKQNIANLAIFVTKHTMSIETARELEPEHLGVLININCEIAAGLRAKAA
ncbi:MAG TPA: flagellar biosynthesis regulator FlaF [Xanthobacteraceae bacterium]|jgi:flagellar biosynthesis activator protein FlaF|nr:flagellar biosynthesis regulator FlaF [Xanthobacteraceae bacterium]